MTLRGADHTAVAVPQTSANPRVLVRISISTPEAIEEDEPAAAPLAVQTRDRDLRSNQAQVTLCIRTL